MGIKMVELSIQSSSAQTRQAARSTVISYVANYNLKKKLGKLIDLYCSQLNYEMESGRLSASESISSILTGLHSSKIDPHATFIFVSLAPHLINDDSTTCRKSVTSTISWRVTFLLFSLTLLVSSSSSPVWTLFSYTCLNTLVAPTILQFRPFTCLQEL